MANLYTNLATDHLDTPAADTWSRNPGVEETGVLLSREAVYTTTTGTDETSGDKLYICKIPANFRIRPDLCKIVAEALGTAFNIASIGVEAVDGTTTLNDADEVSGAVNITAGGAFDLAFGATVAGLTGVTTTKEMWLIATLGTVTSPTASKKIRFLLTGASAV